MPETQPRTREPLYLGGVGLHQQTVQAARNLAVKAVRKKADGGALPGIVGREGVAAHLCRVGADE